MANTTFEIRQGVVDDHLVHGALQERGVQGHHRLLAARRARPAGQAHRMLLGDARVHETARGTPRRSVIEARAALHGCRDGHDVRSSLARLGGERRAEHARCSEGAADGFFFTRAARGNIVAARCRGTSRGSAPRAARSRSPCRVTTCIRARARPFPARVIKRLA